MARQKQQPKQTQPPVIQAPLPPLVTLITPTGGRPEAFAWLEKMVRRQTYNDLVQWIIVDDCTPETKLTIPSSSNIKQEYYRGPKEWRPGINTQRPNMDEAIKHIKGTYVFVIEDDDFLSPTYIATMLKFLRDWPIVGECSSTYYNVKERCYKEWNNMLHASLCQTAFHKDHLSILDEAVNSGELFMDISFWRKVKEKKLPALMFHGLNLVVGVKGLPGRFGIGAGHKPEGFIRDPGFEKLVELVGKEDAEIYRQMIGSTQPIVVKPTAPQPTPTPIAKVIAKVEETMAVKKIVATPAPVMVETKENNPFIMKLTSDSYGKIRSN